MGTDAGGRGEQRIVGSKYCLETVFSLATDVSVGGTEGVGEVVRGAEGGGQLAWPEVKEE